MFDKEAPLLFRLAAGGDQWRWGLKFLAQCNDVAFERNVQQIVALAPTAHRGPGTWWPAPALNTTGLGTRHRALHTDQKSSTPQYAVS